MKSFTSTHYRKDHYGNFISPEEAGRAMENGHLTRTPYGYKDPETKEEFWQDGTKRWGLHY